MLETMARSSSYHKEDLRGDLVAAGRAYVTEQGYSSLSVRTLAQKVGVSPGAPYHHFPDRRSLLLAIALEGFKELIDAAVAISQSGRRGMDQLAELGLSFIEFCDANPRLAELMYESELNNPRHDPEIEAFQQVGQSVIRNAIKSELPQGSAKDVEIRAVAFWSAVYGFAALRRKHNIQSFETFEMKPDEVARSVVTQAAQIASGR